MTLEGIIIAAIAMGGIAAALAIFLIFADSKLKTVTDPRVDTITDMLPGSNCGGCGVPGCSAFAEALINGTALPSGCVAGDGETVTAIAAFLGVEAGTKSRMLAVIQCKGGHAEALQRATYRGEMSCTAADIGGGGKGCVYGCLGLGECVDSCEFGAMAMDDNGLPVVFYDKCVGCGACVKACPRDLIELFPEEQKLFVYCKNKDKGPKAKKVCKVACIACTLCTKDCEVEGGVTMVDNLAYVDHSKGPLGPDAIKRCPTKCILYDVEKDVTKERFLSARKETAV